MGEDCIMEVKNLTYNEFGSIDCEINHPDFGWIPFTASPNDCEELGGNIFQRAIKGDFGEIPYYVVTDEDKAEIVRAERGVLLVELDKIVSNPLRWGSLPQEIQCKFSSYRRELLDVPQQPGFPWKVCWPDKPF